MADYSGIKPGRQLDRLIEEKVFKRDLDVVAESQFPDYRRHNTGAGMSGSEKYDAAKHRDRMLCIAVPLYSYFLDDAAWKIVEHLQKQGISLTIRPYTPPSKGYRVAIECPCANEVDYQTGLDAPSTICYAALLAIDLLELEIIEPMH